MKVAAAMAKLMRDYGAEHIFTLTGAPQEPLLSLKRNEGVKVVLCHNERAAMYMADGYARYSAKPTFTFNQFGPGVAALAAGLSDPFWGHSPVVSISSAIPTDQMFRFAYQELDQQALLAPLTKFVGYAPTPDRAVDVLHRAIIEAVSGLPGPSHVDVALNYLDAELKEKPVTVASPRHMQVPAQRPEPCADEIAAAVQIIAAAKRPVLFTGGGAIHSRAWDKLTALAEALDIPVATSLSGKGSIAETHRLSLGVAGSYSRKVANDVLREADAVIAVGMRLGVHPTVSFVQPRAEAKLVQIDLDARTIGRNFRTDAGIVADARAALVALTAALNDKADENADARASWANECTKKVQAWRDTLTELASERMLEGRINPRFLMTQIDAFMGKDDMIVADTGYSAGWTGTMVELKQAGRRFFRAHGSLGWAFPASIGVSLAAKGAGRVLCLTGDGGFSYHLTEIETALRMKVPVTVIVLNNSRLGFEYTMQKLYHGGSEDETQRFSETDYSAIATAYGAHAERVEKPDDILPALERAASSGKPAIVDVVTSPEVGAPYAGYENVKGIRVL